MSSFDPVEFVGNPSVDELKNTNVCKDDLKYIAKSNEIPFAYDNTKAQLKDLIIAHLTDGNAVLHSGTGTADPNIY